MAHELTATDQMVIAENGKPAWHGLGLIFPQSLTPREASQIVFPYTVVQKVPWYQGINGKTVVCDSFRVNIRSDNGQELGTVSENYCVVQPLDMADFCEALSDEGGVKIETAGSIRSGARMWFLLKGEAFSVAMGDQVMPYILVSNSFDSSGSFRITPTTVRVVCSNTLHMVIPRVDTGELSPTSFSIRHTANIKSRILEAKAALANYGKAIDGSKQAMETMAAKQVTTQQLQEFFTDLYVDQFTEIPVNPKDGHEERRAEKAKSAYLSFSKRFDDEKAIGGTSIWTAANAWSGLCQHDLKSRGADDELRVEKRVESNLFGLNADRTNKAFSKAFKFALAK